MMKTLSLVALFAISKVLAKNGRTNELRRRNLEEVRDGTFSPTDTFPPTESLPPSELGEGTPPPRGDLFPPGEPDGSPVDGETDTITSFFAAEYSTSMGTIDGLEAAADALATAYNALSFDDPFNRQMDDVTVLAVEFPERRERRLQTFSIFVLLQVVGTCSGCPNDSFYSNQLTDRKLASEVKRSGRVRGLSSSGTSGSRSSSKSSSKKSGSKGRSKGSRKNDPRVVEIQGVPTEEEILSAYSQELQESMVDFGNIVDVLTLVELDENPLLEEFEEGPGPEIPPEEIEEGPGPLRKLQTTSN